VTDRGFEKGSVPVFQEVESSKNYDTADNNQISKGPYYLFLMVTATFRPLVSLWLLYVSCTQSLAILADFWIETGALILRKYGLVFIVSGLNLYWAYRIILLTLKFKEILIFQDKVVINGTAFDPKLIEMKFFGGYRGRLRVCWVYCSGRRICGFPYDSFLLDAPGPNKETILDVLSKVKRGEPVIGPVEHRFDYDIPPWVIPTCWLVMIAPLLIMLLCSRIQKYLLSSNLIQAR
jgi:hypothetical protein